VILDEEIKTKEVAIPGLQVAINVARVHVFSENYTFGV